jgi:hypothetical protein
VWTFARSGAADRVYEFVEFDIPLVGRGRAEFGIDHAFPDKPFYVTVRYPDETAQTLRFRDIDEFAAYRSRDTIFAEPGSGLHTDLMEDARTQARIREKTGDDWGGPLGNATIGGPKAHGSSAAPIAAEELIAAVHSEGPALIDAQENPFTAIGANTTVSGRILDVGAGGGGKALTMARVHPHAKVRALEPDEDLRTFAADMLPLTDPEAAKRIQLDELPVQRLIERGQAGTYSQVNLMAPIPGAGFESVANAPMDLVAPGGSLNLHTENKDVFLYVQRELHSRGWTLIEIHGEGPIKSFIPESIPTVSDESFGDEGFYEYGLIALRPLG